MTIINLTEAERRLRDVRSVALGGMLMENRPSTLVRALLRSGTAGLFLCSAPAASWDADVLLGAGRVRTVRIPHISLAGLGLAPATRRAAAAGTVVFEDCDEAILLGGYLAASGNVPIQVLHNLGTNDLVDDNPLLIRAGDLVGVGPLRVDVALLHAPLGDEQGNLVHFGSRWADVLIARSARHVIAQVDQVVPTAVAARLGVSVPGYLVDEVVETPFGAHPLGSVGAYVADLDHLASYQATVNAGGLDDYLERYCAVDHRAYLERIAPARLRELAELGER
jgi:glutaconate CoA-transferase subunit A